MNRTKNEKFIIFSALAQLGFFIALLVYPSKEPILNDPVDLEAIALILGMIGSFPFYMYGYIKTIEEKGFPKVMNLLMFTGIIGFIVVLAIEKRSEQVASHNSGSCAPSA